MQSLSQSQEKILMPEEYIDLVNQEASLISLGSEITSSIVDSYADNKKMKKIKEEPELDDVYNVKTDLIKLRYQEPSTLLASMNTSQSVQTNLKSLPHSSCRQTKMDEIKITEMP